MTLRLARHDEIVERMKEAVLMAFLENRDAATAALDALLTVVRELGVGREASAWEPAEGVLMAESPPDFDWQTQPHSAAPALILQLEEKQ